MIGIWLQATLIGLTAKESRLWRQWAADSTRWDSVLRSWGYWNADIPSGYAGLRYTLGQLSWTGDTASIFSPKTAKRWRHQPITPTLLSTIPRYFQRKLQEKGFLFSEVEWHHIHCDSTGKCHGALRLTPGALVRLDTIIIRGKWIAPRSAFYQITRLRPNQPLCLNDWEALPRRIRSSPYATLIDTPQLWLFPGLAWIEIQLKPKSANRIDGALSVLPPNQGNRVQAIGHLELALLSPFRLGEKIEARFAQLPGSSQRLNLRLAFPYLLRGYMETRGEFALWKQDTSFLTREASVELRYRLTSTLSLLAGYQGITSRLINILPYKERVWPPPPILDFQRRGIRIGWQYEQIDFRPAPRRGWQLSLLGTQGRRGYIRNPGLMRLAYERLPTVGNFQEINGSLRRYTPFGAVLSLHTSLSGYKYLAKMTFENELPRAGGSQNLRPFPENTFPTAGYLHGAGELRLHIDEEGLIAGFFEGTLMDIYGQGEKVLQGLGLLLQTRLAAGLLQVTLAAGRVVPAPLDWRRALVRVEWVSEF
ncbi:MAG: hypothetical protein NZZ60_08290 [Bacteroidia bacterium]|nr:hypothetical protein [Bacteroidia bacterium]MCX7651970.1 hypothetical protein [Bacteroidia bacterium]MDW8416121.1 hypothetical protein [Bacteroidia bacterium]